LAGLGDMYEQQRTQAQTREIEARTRILTQEEDKTRRETEDAKVQDAKLQAIWEQWGAKDVKRAVALTYQVKPEAAAKMDEQIAKSAKEWAAGFGIEQDNKRKQTKHFAGLIATAPTPEVLAAVKQQWAAIDPEDAAPFASIVDPKDPAMKGVLEMAMQAEKVYEGRAKAAEFIQKSQGEGAFVQGIAQLLAVTPKDFWDETLDGAGPLLGEFQRNAMEAMSPDQMRQLAMGQTEVVKTAETGRHNLAQEGIAVRGQDVSAQTQRRGQDISAATARRGQNLTDARTRETAKTTGGVDLAGLPNELQLSTMLLQSGTTEARAKSLANAVKLAHQMGGEDRAKGMLVDLAMATDTVENKKRGLARRTAAVQLKKIQEGMDALEREGVSPGLFRGTMEEGLRKIGQTHNPKVAQLVTQMDVAYQNYRQFMTGANFGADESREYKRVYPGFEKTLPLNKAIIAGMMTSMAEAENAYLQSRAGKYALPDTTPQYDAATGATPVTPSPETGTSGGGSGVPSYADYLKRKRGGR
jgi:hypothetical protein